MSAVYTNTEYSTYFWRPVGGRHVETTMKHEHPRLLNHE